ncbi:unnamed protein product [Rotaria sp. Silwood1]|nr:unnamed protein product [Rotaria sp. Silwood1]CAF5050812.1 unnamed protein product [Rotaria sp. Silwood1]
MEALARQHLYKPIEVTVGGRSIVCQDVVQNVLIFDDDDQKYAKLLELLGLYQPYGSVLVFVESQIRCDELIKKLMSHSYSCMPLHGGLDQYNRDSTITFFKNGDIPLIIATSVAARGLDVKNLILVVNYDCPNHYEEYVHRCGRTGRAGNVGYAYTFITSAQGKFVGAIIKALETSGASVPAELTLLWDNYVKQMEAQGKKVQDIRGSFGGRHGYNFDSSDKQHKNIQKRMQGILIGLEDVDDDDEEIDQQIESIYKSNRSISTKDEVPVTQNETSSPLETAKRITARLSAIQYENPGVPHDVTLSLAAARQRAQELNAKLNYEKPPDKTELNESTPTTYEEELEINDFPTNVRSRIVSTAILNHVRDYADVDIYVRGEYYPKNKKLLSGEKKLHLQIRSLNEYGLQIAKAEITRLIKEEMIKMQNTSLQSANRGRYKVV